MSASATLTATRARGSLLRGSVLGMGLLVAGSTVASPASADEGSAPEGSDPEVGRPVELSATAAPLVQDDEWTSSSPVGTELPTADFGNQKTLSIDLAAPRDAPPDLSLAGAVFDLVRSNGTVAAQCTTTHAGECRFWSSVRFSLETPSASNAEAPAGQTLTVRQSRRSAGLALLPGDLGTVYFCGVFECGGGRWTYYTPDSLFHDTFEGTVTDVVDGAALAGRTFALTGPGYPRTDGTVVPASGSWGTATSDADGKLAWSGWFLPGDYSLSAVSDGDGALSGEPAGVTVADWTPFQEEHPAVEVALRYVRPVVPEEDPDGGTGENGGAPSDEGSEGGATGSTGAPAGPATQSPVKESPATGRPARPGAGGTPGSAGSDDDPALPVTARPTVGDPSAGVAPGESAPEPPRRPSPVPGLVAADEAEDGADPTAAPAPTGGAQRTVAPPSASAAVPVAPRLETASSGVSEMAAVGLGALLLAAAGTGFLLLRMRRRNRDA